MSEHNVSENSQSSFERYIPQPGDVITCTVEKIAYQGKAIARINGLVCFVIGGIPGDTVTVEITKKKRRYCEGIVRNLIQPSPQRVPPRCTHFGTCGGCKWQHLQYSAQLEWKRLNVQETFERLAQLEYEQLLSTLPSPRIWEYRNKMDFSFAPHPHIPNRIVGGLHQTGRFDTVVNLQECWLHSQRAIQILDHLRRQAELMGVTAYDPHTHQGFLRNLVVRTVKASDQIMLLLVTSPPVANAELLFLDWYSHEFAQQFSEQDTILHVTTTNRAQVATGEIEQIIGPGFLEEQINDLHFRISPFAFFQPNPYQAEQLFRFAIQTAAIQPTDIVWDLYCGTGSITLHAAQRAYHAFGIELIDSAIADARTNAQLNHLHNVTFHTANLHKTEGIHLLRALPQPDIVFLDPPRAGVHRRILSLLNEIRPTRILYISCNPTTQARDCHQLSLHYSLRLIQPVDMFPHTYHIESVVLLERK